MTMRFMVIVKADSNSEAGVMPSTELLTAMGKFNEEMVKAGLMLAGEGLHPSLKGARVGYTGKERTVSRGPFGLTGLVSGFWLIETKSLDEAIDWMKRAPLTAVPRSKFGKFSPRKISAMHSRPNCASRRRAFARRARRNRTNDQIRDRPPCDS
jgi:hypothetical protein